MALATTLLALALALPASTAPSAPPALYPRAPADYAPRSAPCPPTFTRPATGLAPQESAYLAARSPAAAVSLQQWLASTAAGFGTPDTYPTLALATSGGGFRALLTGAGVHQTMDARDGASAVSGLYQALTYESGLSGGGWLVGSIAGNGWPTVTALRTGLWERTFAEGLLLPGSLGVVVDDGEIVGAVAAKAGAGFSPTLVDGYGRLLGYALLEGEEGGVAETWSGVVGAAAFQSASVPFPILTATGVDAVDGVCYPDGSAPLFELTPYEWGSWDEGVQAFAEMEYIGSRAGQCVTGYDNLGYVMGTTSDVFNGLCIPIPDALTEGLQGLTNALEDLLNVSRTPDTRALLSPYPNPFAAQPTELDLADGGETNQNDPIWPFLYRDVDVLFVADSSSDTSDNYPNGTAIFQTYTRAQAVGLSRMPPIPPPSTIVAQGLNKRPTFFGCNATDAMTIVWLPNADYTYDSGQSSAKLQYSVAETDAMIANGNAVGSFNGSATFGTCVGCAVLAKGGTQLPGACEECFSEFCAT